MLRQLFKRDNRANYGFACAYAATNSNSKISDSAP